MASKCPNCGKTVTAKRAHSCVKKRQFFTCGRCGGSYNNFLTHICKRSFKKGGK